MGPSEMTRVKFGVSSSPYVAIRTTWRAADDAGPDMTEAATAVRKKDFVDDFLASTNRIEDAVKEAIGVKKMLANGDFYLGNWVSNDTQLLEAVKSSTDGGFSTKDTTCSLGEDPGLILGIVWDPVTDMLGFRVKVASVIYTRVGLQSQVAGLFDPLGTAAPMTVKAKIKLW
jgi:hypothetical protein